jgi:hypothetical protein
MSLVVYSNLVTSICVLGSNVRWKKKGAEFRLLSERPEIPYQSFWMAARSRVSYGGSSLDTTAA